MSTANDWQRWCAQLAELGERLQAAAPDEQTRALATGYLARLSVYALEREFLGAQRELRGLNWLAPRVGGYNPDYRMAQARLDPARRYRLGGRLNDTYRLGIGIYSALAGGRLQLDAYATQRDLDVDAQGGFSVELALDAAGRNRLALRPTSNVLMLRQLDLRPADRPAELSFECLDAPAVSASSGSLSAAGQFVDGIVGQFLYWTQRFDEFRNHMVPLPEDLNQAVRGDPGTRYYVGSFDLSQGGQLQIDIPDVSCDYWGLALSSWWLEPLASHLNHATARIDVDGRCRVQLYRDRTDGANVLDTGGLQRGVIWYRSIDADREAVPVLRYVKV